MPHYEPRNVEIIFGSWSRTPRIFADGSKDSPHRYSDNSLCIWHPGDPPDQRWIFEDGLLALINLIQAHLFREEWWRETGEWLGPEAPHTPPKVKEEDNDERRQLPPR